MDFLLRFIEDYEFHIFFNAKHMFKNFRDSNSIHAVFIIVRIAMIFRATPEVQALCSARSVPMGISDQSALSSSAAVHQVLWIRCYEAGKIIRWRSVQSQRVRSRRVLTMLR